MISSKNPHFKQRLFNFILTRGSLDLEVTGYTLVHREGPISLWCGPDQTFRRVGDAFIMGDVFELTSKTEDSDGHFVGVKFENDSALVFRSPGSPLGIFYGEIDGQHFVFSDFFEAQFRMGWQLLPDTQAEEDFLDFGFVSLGRTLFQGVSRLTTGSRLRLNDLGEWSLVSEPAVPVARDFHLLLHERLRKWLGGATFRAFAMSGGMDSRLLASTLANTQPKSEVRIYSRAHPSLTPETDRDVIVARSVAAQLPFEFTVMHHQASEAIYFSQVEPSRFPILSGLCGGEFLGGVVMDLVELGNLPSRKSAMLELIERRRTFGVELQADVALKIDLLNESFLTSVYGGNWMAHLAHQNLTLSPFYDAHIVTALKAMGAEAIQDYRLYRQVFDALPEAFRNLPLNSIAMLSCHSDLPTVEEGLEPKTRSAPVAAQTARERHSKILERFYGSLHPG